MLERTWHCRACEARETVETKPLEGSPRCAMCNSSDTYWELDGAPAVSYRGDGWTPSKSERS